MTNKCLIIAIASLSSYKHLSGSKWSYKVDRKYWWRQLSHTAFMRFHESSLTHPQNFKPIKTFNQQKKIVSAVFYSKRKYRDLLEYRIKIIKRKIHTRYRSLSFVSYVRLMLCTSIQVPVIQVFWLNRLNKRIMFEEKKESKTE